MPGRSRIGGTPRKPMRIERPQASDAAPGRRQPAAPASYASGEKAGGYPVPAVVGPQAGRGEHAGADAAGSGLARPSAAFVAQLLAGRLNLESSRMRRRASPETAGLAYGETTRRMREAFTPASRGVLV